MSTADTLRIAGIMRESIVDGPGIRFAIFCQGCPHRCPDCHNPETHDFNGGTQVSIQRILAAIDENPLLKGVTFSGGEPTCQAEGFAALAKAVKARGMDITLFSGYTFEQLEERAKEEPALAELLELTDLLIDGPFVKARKDLTLQFRGSSNQRLIDMNATRQAGKIVLWHQD
ncbi:MAG: anaerobic ribonucleoside-triphosphate reductase activating protein [Firmicutes bacterium]|nr:anaerobic ribonucleoside-triphosphate reductase activating protein [Bacillota bacterium]